MSNRKGSARSRINRSMSFRHVTWHGLDGWRDVVVFPLADVTCGGGGDWTSVSFGVFCEVFVGGEHFLAVYC